MTQLTIRDGKRLRLLRRTKNRNLPEHWNELSAKQLIAIASALRGGDNNKLLSAMMNVTTGYARRMAGYFKYKIGKELAWINRFEAHNEFIIEIPGREPPGKDLTGMTFGQFMFIDTFHDDWLESNKEEDLNKFVGCLYLPEGEIFKSDCVTEYAEGARYLQFDKKAAIALNYRLVQEYLTNIYPWIFSRRENEESVQQKGPKGTWLPLFESLVGDNITRQEEYFNLPAHTVFRYISKKMKENAKNGR